MTKTNKDFIIRIPLNMLLRIKNPVTRSVFLTVYSFTDNGSGECFASIRKIAERSGHGKHTVQRHLGELVDQNILKISGTKKVQGGEINIYKVSRSGSVYIKSVPVRPSSPPEVSRSAPEVSQKAVHKQLKETLPAPIKKKPTLVSTKVWDETSLSYQKSVLNYQAQGQRVKSPKALFLKILKDTAQELGDHKYLASTLTDSELRARVNDFSQETPQEYFLTAKDRSLL